MDTFVDSSWYFTRFPDSQNETELFSQDSASSMPLYTCSMHGSFTNSFVPRVWSLASKASRNLSNGSWLRVWSMERHSLTPIQDVFCCLVSLTLMVRTWSSG